MESEEQTEIEKAGSSLWNFIAENYGLFPRGPWFAVGTGLNDKNEDVIYLYTEKKSKIQIENDKWESYEVITKRTGIPMFGKM